MADEKSERLGLRGRLALIESALRLLGGANATGAIAAGVAFHAFEKNAEVQSSVKIAALLFLFGIFTFAIAFMSLFMATYDIDSSLHKEGEPTWPEYLFWVPIKSAEEYRKAGKREFVASALIGLVSFILFLVGLVVVLTMAVRLALS